jgi:ABC-type lipoprotein release transport system permease subunit
MMSLAFTIAWRNLWRHRGKSIVIGVILFLGALLMTVGNGLISGMEKGLAENIVNSFTGDIVVISKGGVLQPGERGVLISEEARKQIYDFMNFWTTPAGTAVSRKKCRPRSGRRKI